MRATLAILVAIASIAACLWTAWWLAAALSSNIRHDQNQSANLWLVLVLLQMAWGVASAVGVLCRREWARLCFVVWAILTAVLCVRFHTLGFSAGLLLGAWLVGRARTVRRSPS